MRSHHLGATDCTHATVSGEDDDGSEGGLQSAVEECETLDVQHVYLIHKQHTRDQLCNTLINVLVHHFVDFCPQLFCDLSLLRLHHGTHHGAQVLTTLRPGVCQVQVMQGNILHNLLLLVDIALGQWHVLFGLRVELCGVRIGAAHTFHCTAVRLHVDDITRGDLLFLD